MLLQRIQWRCEIMASIFWSLVVVGRRNITFQLWTGRPEICASIDLMVRLLCTSLRTALRNFDESCFRGKCGYLRIEIWRY